MQLKEVRDILNAKVLCGEHLLDREVYSACGADLMSDVLAFVKEQSVLLTGLLNPQVVRTAEMMDMLCIVFVRGKVPDRNIIELARDRDIVMMCTDYKMYTACGKLYQAGLVGMECE
ncbi:MAG: hypothetical protein GX193_04870 [Clostridiales bacterium]|nr:hypothetical protein [Clostridiales bacterium]